MHRLLGRQIKNYFPEELKDHPDIAAFFEAVDRSYSDYDEKLQMIQRATTLSSRELYEANKRLNKETESQRKVLETLSKAVMFMENKTNEKQSDLGFDPQRLVENIENQTYKIVEMTAEKDSLLRNLEQQNESLNNYAHMVSHDLKSPIRNIHSLVSWVLEDGHAEIKDGNKNSFDLIFQNLAKMDNLIDGILRHATIDSLEEQMVNVDVHMLIREIEHTLYVPSQIRIVIKGKLPELYTGKYRLEQLFKNLIMNAVNALEDENEGFIVIEAQEDGNHWLFSIKDNGKGIPPHLQAGIFGMFKKLENKANTTGIGLALVKKIINYYKGDIWLSSEEGIGTTFFFTIKTQI